MSATELARRIRNREVSAREVVQTHINRLLQVNSQIRAVVHSRFELALCEADRWDKQIGAKRVNNAPLAGVPCTIKESFALKGMPNTAGHHKRIGLIATEDAVTVSRLRRAGAIPIGVTNTSELCMWMETNNHVYGRTNNPYDSNRIVGGSSGGEGAAVASGASPFGLGSDIGGSIRMPAFFCGVFGHKPSGGMVPGTGQYPAPSNEAWRYLTTGPLCRRAEDLMPLMQTLSGPDGRDPGCSRSNLSSPDSVRWKGLRVLLADSNGLRRVSSDIRESQKRAATILEQHGADVVLREFPALERSLDLWANLMSAAADVRFGEILTGHVSPPLVKLLWDWVMRRSIHTIPAIALTAIERAIGKFPRNILELRRTQNELREELTNAIGTNGVLLFPPYTRAAPRHLMPLLTPIDWVYTAIFNVMEFPVTQAPTGLNRNGLPVGVQIVSFTGNDHLTIAVAHLLEKALGGWYPPADLAQYLSEGHRQAEIAPKKANLALNWTEPD